MSLPPGMREALPQRQPQQPIPEFYVGQRIEAKIVSMSPSTYTNDKGEERAQIQFDVKLEPTEYEARSWISYYKIPNPKQKIGQLYLAIQRVTGKTYQNADEAMEALKNYGKIFFEMTGYRSVGNTSYPKFAVIANMLPGEGISQPTSKLPSVLPTQITSGTSLNEKVYDWLVANQDIIGKQIPSEVYNKFIGQGIIEELHRLGHVKMVQEYPWLDESARTLLMK